VTHLRFLGFGLTVLALGGVPLRLKRNVSLLPLEVAILTTDGIGLMQENWSRLS